MGGCFSLCHEGKECETERVIFFEQISLEIEVCKMNVRSGVRLHPLMLSLGRSLF